MAGQVRPAVVITGESAGVGRATARGFARRGWGGGLIALGPNDLAGAVKDIWQPGAKPLETRAGAAN